MAACTLATAEVMAIMTDSLYDEIRVRTRRERRMVTVMQTIELSSFTKYRNEISELKKEVESLKNMNSELNEKVLGIYGAYETLQYTTRGRLMSCSAEIVRLRGEIEELKLELHARGWVEQPK
jgi:predicted RNase H-like nuclease (RuvC/YqgF family)